MNDANIGVNYAKIVLLDWLFVLVLRPYLSPCFIELLCFFLSLTLILMQYLQWLTVAHPLAYNIAEFVKSFIIGRKNYSILVFSALKRFKFYH
jgi:hypothetical protein